MLLVSTVLILSVVCGIILLFGDPEAPTFLGRCHYMLIYAIPERLYSMLVRLRLSWVVDCGKSVYAFFFLQRNPFVLILYLALVLTSFAAIILKAYPRFPNLYFAEYHRITGTMMMGLCLFVFYKAATVDAGQITKQNLAEYDNYAYDEVLYSNIECPTCKMPKLARSKHCRIMDMCISRFDHYCIWLNRAVGEKNYRWFLAFLLAHSFILFYGVAAVGSIFLSDIDELQLWKTTFIERSTRRHIQPTYWIIFYVLFERHYALMFVFVLCCMMSLVLSAFTGYHLYLAATNTTTNESSKWAQVLVKYEQWQSDYHYAKSEMPRVSARLQKLLNMKKKPTDEEQNEIERMRHELSLLDSSLAQRPPEELPQNIYDRGWKENLLEALFPLSLRNDSSKKHALHWQLEKGGVPGPTHHGHHSGHSSHEHKSRKGRRRKKTE
eukprot:gb/GECG01013954.1/.p1 GENE.gb/GECG01013954.1/~~gb/GECG01013954.1/.p1  ORF type:complete len:438 (+),score=29.63 gb/GECG01013954.1/:1-1314(+)